MVWCIRHPLLVALVAAVAARVCLWVFAGFIPIPNEDQQPISPLIAYSDIDLTFYMNSREYYRALLASFFGGGGPVALPWATDVEPAYAYAGPPLFPILLEVFRFGPDNPIPLSAFYLLTAVLVTVYWLTWLRRNGIELIGLIGFALLPIPFWFMLNISSDLPFAALIACFFFFFFEARKGRSRLWGLFILVGLAVATRLHGVALAGFVFFAASWPGLLKRSTVAALVVSAAALALLGTVYQDYGVDFLRTGNRIAYFSITQEDYLAGIFPSLPSFLDHTLSIIALMGAKLLYMTGLRPTWWHTPIHFVLIRAAAGVVLLPGLLYLVFRGNPRHRVFVGLFILPLLLGAAQERYLLGVIPILYLYGIRAWQDVYAVVSQVQTKRSVSFKGDPR